MMYLPTIHNHTRTERRRYDIATNLNQQRMRQSYIFTLLGLTALATPAVGRAAADDAPPQGMARIILEAHDPYGDATSGFQWVLDSSHSSYGDIFDAGGFMYFGDYAAFDKSLPVGADAVAGSANSLVDGELTLDVPAGVYDWMVVAARPTGIYMSWGDAAAVDDFEFVEGGVYRVVCGAEEQFGSLLPSASLQVSSDLELSKVLTPRSGADLSDAEQVTILITNTGSRDIIGFTASYTINGDLTIHEDNPDVTIAAGESHTYTFTTPADLSAHGDYLVDARIDSAADMLPANNAASASCRNMAPTALPLSLDFSLYLDDDFDADWTLFDLNGDGSSWYYTEYMMNNVGEQGTVCVSGPTNRNSLNSDDWMISLPLSMKSGPHNMRFALTNVVAGRDTSLEVAIGQAPYPEDMQVIARLTTADNFWNDRLINFPIDTEGVYYIGFRYIGGDDSVLAMNGLWVSEGEATGQPKMETESLLLPISNCDLPTDARLGMRVMNLGTAALEDYSLTVSVNGKATTTRFTDPIEPFESADLYADATFDLSAIATYDITMRLDGAPEALEKSATVECMPPYTDLPFTSYFSYNQNTDMWTTLQPDSWSFDPIMLIFDTHRHGRESGLMTRGLALTHPARIYIEYMAGGYDWSQMAVYIGRAGEDVSTYTEVFRDTYVDGTAKNVELLAPIDGPGNYSIVIADEGMESSESFIRLNLVTVSEALPYDIRVNSIEGPVARFMPEAHTGRTGTYIAEVENRGSETMQGIRLIPTVDGIDQTPTAESVTLQMGEKALIPVSIDLPAKSAGKSITVSITAEGDTPDEYADDNTYQYPTITVTDTTLANENVEIGPVGTGNSGMPIGIGTVYTLAADSDLTAVQLGMASADDHMPSVTTEIGLNIYLIDEADNIVRRIYDATQMRGKEGWLTFDMPDMRLAAGRYYFEAEQTSTWNMGLLYDIENYATCYQRQGDHLTRTMAHPLAIRATFGKDAVVYAKDAAVRAITAPATDSALFDAESPAEVRAIIRNNGYQAAEFNAEMRLDGRVLAGTTVALQPYEEQEVYFGTADLSEPGDREIEVATLLKGDENPANDSCIKRVESQQELSPLFLDFESCADFSAHGDAWNPRWTTVDYLGQFTNFYWAYSFPGSGQPVGFIAFNPAATVPSMIEEGFRGVTPYSGERFGMVFVYDGFAPDPDELPESDAWLISPRVKLGEDSRFEAYVKTRDLESPSMKLEPFRVKVSLTDTEPASFVSVGDEHYEAPVEDWGLVSVDLSAYDGKEVYVAVQYIGKPGVNDALMIDDVRIVTTDTSGVAPIESGEACEVRVEGRDIIAPEGSVVFTTDGLRCGMRSLGAGIYIVVTPDGVSHKLSVR